MNVEPIGGFILLIILTYFITKYTDRGTRIKEQEKYIERLKTEILRIKNGTE